MRCIKIIFLFITIVIMNINLYAQKQIFDIVSYTPPKGWTETPGNSNVSYSRIENGNWAQITIYKSDASSGAVDIDFDKDWKELVAVNKNISTPQKSNPKSADGWMIQSGNGTYSIEIKDDPN